jgi:hypothetical protein
MQKIFKGRQSQVKDVHCLVALVRLPQVQSDLLVSLTTPCSSSSVDDTSGTLQLFQDMLKTLVIKDYSLFGA